MLELKLTVFGLAAQRKTLEFCILLSRAAKIFRIYQQKQPKLSVFCSAAQRKLLEFANKSNSNKLYFVQPRSGKF
jgi:hypothetical protein